MRQLHFPSLLVLLLSATLPSPGEETPDPRIALDGTFPHQAGATRFSGELILVEHVNRLGILRLDRDGTINKYHWDLPHHFRMLPYGAIHYRGAPAALEDIPLGTHLHGLFHLGPEGDFQISVPESGYVASKMANPDLRSVVSQYSQALRLEDNFSYHQSRGEGWKIVSFGLQKRTVTVERVSLQNGSPVDAAKANDGIPGTQILRLEEDARLWKGRQIADLADLAEGQAVQINFTWVSLLGSTKEDGICREIWIDEESRAVATAQQRRIHLANLKRRGVPATILQTESLPGEGARGHVTFAFHHGIDAELLGAFQEKCSLMVWAAEPSLRVYDALGDTRPGSVVELHTVEDPPPGHGGIEVRAHFYEMIEGFRAGRTIRVALRDWSPPPRPLEELLWPHDTRIFQTGPKPVADRDGPPHRAESLPTP